jgi:translation elongation factor EF-1alpha
MDCKHGFAAAFFKANGPFNISLEISIPPSGSSNAQTRYERQRGILENRNQISSGSQFQLNSTHHSRPSKIISLLQIRNQTTNATIPENQFSSKRGRKRTRRH